MLVVLFWLNHVQSDAQRLLRLFLLRLPGLRLVDTKKLRQIVATDDFVGIRLDWLLHTQLGLLHPVVVHQ